MSAPPAGMTPKGRPIRVPRAQAGAASRISFRDSQGRPVEFTIFPARAKRSTTAQWMTSPRARTATVTVTSEIPSNRYGESMVNRGTPVTASTPTTAMPSPSSSDSRPFTAESVTTEEVATNANRAWAKYSAGPKLADRSASHGARNTTATEETKPPMNAPIAAVARAWAARPFSAILWPSKVEAIAEACPGVFMRMPIVESPNSPPKYTPENMMNAAVGSRAKVTGSSRATAIEDPSPGITPTAVPSRQPSTTQNRFCQVSAPAKPSASSEIASIRNRLPESRRAGSAPGPCRTGCMPGS